MPMSMCFQDPNKDLLTLSKCDFSNFASRVKCKVCGAAQAGKARTWFFFLVISTLALSTNKREKKKKTTSGAKLGAKSDRSG